MQKRYCSCGQAIWVEYRCTRRAWMALLHTARQENQKQRSGGRCTGCGQPLHIDRLY